MNKVRCITYGFLAGANVRFLVMWLIFGVMPTPGEIGVAGIVAIIAFVAILAAVFESNESEVGI